MINLVSDLSGEHHAGKAGAADARRYANWPSY